MAQTEGHPPENPLYGVADGVEEVLKFRGGVDYIALDDSEHGSNHVTTNDARRQR